MTKQKNIDNFGTFLETIDDDHITSIEYTDTRVKELEDRMKVLEESICKIADEYNKGSKVIADFSKQLNKVLDHLSYDDKNDLFYGDLNDE